MKNTFQLSLGLWAGLLVAPTASAQTSPANPAAAQAAEPGRSLNRFGLSYRFGFHIKADFKNLGRTPASDPGPATGRYDRVYQDGYVKIDEGGNWNPTDPANPATQYWGFEHDGQLMGPNLVMSSSRPGNLATEVSHDPHHGLELTYGRQLGSIGPAAWGVEVAFNYLDLSLGHRAVAASSVLAVDAYDFTGVAGIVGGGPYYGGYKRPGPLLPDTPTRAPVSIFSRFDASIYGLKLGPFLEVPLCKKAALTLSGGFAAVFVDGDFRYSESATVPASGLILRQGRNSHLEALPGGYVAAALSWRLSRAWDLFAGVQYQNVGHYANAVNDKQVSLNLNASFFVTAGVGFSF